VERLWDSAEDSSVISGGRGKTPKKKALLMEFSRNSGNEVEKL